MFFDLKPDAGISLALIVGQAIDATSLEVFPDGLSLAQDGFDVACPIVDYPVTGFGLLTSLALAVVADGSLLDKGFHRVAQLEEVLGSRSSKADFNRIMEERLALYGSYSIV